MIPEATLMLALIIVFCADFALHKSERKTYVLSVLTGALLLCQLVPCFLAEPTSAFGGLYVTSAIVNVMKTVLTLGTFIVVVMSQSWLNNHATKISGEFYLLVISTLLGIFILLILIRWIVLLVNKGQVSTNSAWYQVDLMLQKFVYKIGNTFFRNNLTYQKALLVSWISLGIIWLISRVLFGILINLCNSIPF